LRGPVMLRKSWLEARPQIWRRRLRGARQRKVPSVYKWSTSSKMAAHMVPRERRGSSESRPAVSLIAAIEDTK